MYRNNLRKLRNEKEYTQDYVASKLNVIRSTYNSWERDEVMIPLDMADKLSLLYNVRLSYILGIDKNVLYNYKIRPINKNILLNNLKELRKENKHTYSEIASYIKCSQSTAHRYLTGHTIPIDRLILLSELYDIDLDKLCGKL